MCMNINLYKQLQIVMFQVEKKVWLKFRKRINTANGSEIWCYQIYFVLKLTKRNHITFVNHVPRPCSSSNYQLDIPIGTITAPLSIVGTSASGSSTQASTSKQATLNG